MAATDNIQQQWVLLEVPPFNRRLFKECKY